MVITRRTTAALCLTLLWAGTAARADGPLKQTFQKLYAVRDQAADRKDYAALFASYSPDFIKIHLRGNKDNLQALKAHYVEAETKATIIVSASTLQSVSASGPTATAVVVDTIKVVFTDPRSGNPVVAQAIVTSRDTWVKTKSGWFETISKTLSGQITLNGKPVAIPTAPGSSPMFT